jgi:hypothetical protein
MWRIATARNTQYRYAPDSYSRELFGSNLGRVTGYPEGFRGFHQSLQAKPTNDDRFFPNPFQFIIQQSSYHST